MPRQAASQGPARCEPSTGLQQHKMRSPFPAARVLGVVLLLVALLGVALPATAAGADDELIVRYHADAPPARARAALGTAAAVRGGVVARVHVPAGAGDETLRALRAEPGVAWVVPNHRMLRLALPDPAAEPMRARQWHLDQVRADGAWQFTRGNPGMRVAVVDSGVDDAHPDRPTNLVVGPSFAGAPPGDRDGHGTHVTGIIAAPANGVGTVGVAPDVTVMVAKVDDDQGAIRLFDVYRAILWAVDNGANVVNLSLGLAEDSAALREAVEYAQARNVLVVAAAGNSAEAGNSVIFPAAYPGVLAVGASTAIGDRAPYSQFGPHLSLLAPGGTPDQPIVGPLPGGQYGGIAGTSVAAPQAAGAAALVWSLERGLTAAEVRDRLLAAARDVGPAGHDDLTGRGVLDAAAAVRGAAALTPYRAGWRGGTCPTVVAAGGRTSMTFDLANTGEQTWRRDGAQPVRIGTDRPLNRDSAFFTPGAWLSPNRASALPVDAVEPGATARFVVPLQAPSGAGVYREYFHPLAEGAAPMPDLGLYCDVTVVPSTAWLASDGEATVTPATLAPGQSARVTVRIRNAGTETWRRDDPNPGRLGTALPRDRASALFVARTWLSPNRVGPPTAAEVRPGDLATFEFEIVAPTAPGRHEERFAAVIEGVTWLNHEVVVGLDVLPGPPAPSRR
jgi:subtilisin family serine protease